MVTLTTVRNLIAGISAGEAPAGVVSQFAGATAPTGYLLCDGSAVSRTTYSELFTAIGTTYGAGDGSTTFNLPNIKGRVPVGLNASEAEFDALGETGGAKTHSLTADENGTHTHTQNAHTHTQNAHTHIQDAHAHYYQDWNRSTQKSGPSGFNAQAIDQGGYNTGSTTATNQNTTATNQNTTATNQNSGSGTAHNNLQPYIVLNYIIKT